MFSAEPDLISLAMECGRLRASDQILLFNSCFIEKLKNAVCPFTFKIYLLPFLTWFDHSILKELVKSSKNENAVKMVQKFDSHIDYNQLVTSCTVPDFSQLIIPYKEKEAEYTLLVTKYYKNHNEIVIQDLMNIKEALTTEWKITDHAIHLVAIHSKLNSFYWLIPRQIQSMIEDKLTHNQEGLWDKGIVMIALLPDIYLPDETNQYSQGSKFNFWNFSTHDAAKVCMGSLNNVHVCMYVHVCKPYIGF